MKNASIVGLCNILEHDLEFQQDIIDKQNDYIEFDEMYLENFENKYFSYLIDKYKKYTSWYKLTSFADKLLLYKQNIDEKGLDDLNNYIDDLKSKLKSNSYVAAYEYINTEKFNPKEKEKILKKIKKGKKQSIDDVKEEIHCQINICFECIEFLNQIDSKKYILAKNISYDIIQLFWQNVSFLGKSNAKKDSYKEYKDYFIHPVGDYIKEDKSKYKYSCFTCENKLNKIGGKDLTWLVKTGVDGSRKPSHFWNMTSDAYICPVCNLLFSCIPAGFTVIKREGLFINDNSSIERLVRINKVTNLSSETSILDLEQKKYLTIANTLEQKNIEQFNKEVENIQVVRINGNDNSNIYKFNLLSRKKLLLIYNSRKKLSNLIKINVKVADNYYINLYSEVISRLYLGKNLFDLIGLLISLSKQSNNKQSKFSLIWSIYTILEINNYSIGGSGKMHSSQLNEFKFNGNTLRKAYLGSSENKLSGITYRLQNALKTKDVEKFMDTLINSYMYKKMPIPQNFILALENTEKFQNAGYAFLIGLLGDEESNKGEAKND